LIRGTVTITSVGVCTIQDRGRHGFEHLGVPTSGAWDRFSYEVALRLLGSAAVDAGLPVFEVLAGGLGFTCTAAAALVVVGPACLRLDDVEFPTCTTMQVPANGRVVIERLGAGPIYCAIAGLKADSVLRSSSTDTLGGLGPSVVHQGTEWGFASDTSLRFGAFTRPETDSAVRRLRCVIATDALIDPLRGTSWDVTASSRSGVRFEARNHSVKWPELPPEFSGPVLPGILQMPTAHSMIALGPDSGTTGGYSILGAVATVDVSALAYLSPGDVVHVEPVSVSQAQSLFEAQREARIYESGLL